MKKTLHFSGFRDIWYNSGGQKAKLCKRWAVAVLKIGEGGRIRDRKPRESVLEDANRILECE